MDVSRSSFSLKPSNGNVTTHERIEALKKQKQMLQAELDKQILRKNNSFSLHQTDHISSNISQSFARPKNVSVPKDNSSGELPSNIRYKKCKNPVTPTSTATTLKTFMVPITSTTAATAAPLTTSISIAVPITTETSAITSPVSVCTMSTNACSLSQRAKRVFSSENTVLQRKYDPPTTMPVSNYAVSKFPPFSYNRLSGTNFAKIHTIEDENKTAVCIAEVATCVASTTTRKVEVATCIASTTTRKPEVVTCATSTTREAVFSMCAASTTARNAGLATCVVTTKARNAGLATCVASTLPRQPNISSKTIDLTSMEFSSSNVSKIEGTSFQTVFRKAENVSNPPHVRREAGPSNVKAVNSVQLNHKTPTVVTQPFIKTALSSQHSVLNQNLPIPSRKSQKPAIQDQRVGSQIMSANDIPQSQKTVPNKLPLLLIQTPAASQGKNQPVTIPVKSTQVQEVKNAFLPGKQVVKLIPVSLAANQITSFKQSSPSLSNVSQQDLQKLLLNVFNANKSANLSSPNVKGNNGPLIVRLETNISPASNINTAKQNFSLVPVRSTTPSLSPLCIPVSEASNTSKQYVPKNLQKVVLPKDFHTHINSSTHGTYVITNGTLVKNKPDAPSLPPTAMSLKIQDSKVIQAKINPIIDNATPVKISLAAKSVSSQIITSSGCEVSNATKFQWPDSVKGGENSLLKKDDKLQPIQNSGSARTNGIKPYLREDTVIFETNRKLKSTENNGPQYPTIANYKSLAANSFVANTNSDSISLTVCKENIGKPTWAAKSCKPVAGSLVTSDAMTKNWGSRITSTPVISNVFSYNNIKNNLQKNTNSTVIDLTIDSPNKENCRDKSIQNTSTKIQDTVGVVRTDKRVGDEMAKKTFKSQLKNNDSCISTGSKAVKNYNKRKSSDKEEINNIKRVKTVCDFPPSEYTEAPTSFEKISRTFFALDRMRRTQSHLKQIGALDRCMEGLYTLRNALVVERNKQKLFMDDNLRKWKQAALAKNNIPQNVKETKSPAQRLLEKFSLKSFTSVKSPLAEDKKSRPFVQDRLSDKKSFEKQTGRNVSRTFTPSLAATEKSVRDRPKTFDEILAEQRRKKQLKKFDMTIPTSIATTVKVEKNEEISPNVAGEVKTDISKKSPLIKTETPVSKVRSISAISSRNRPVSRQFANPKDPYNSAEDRALQMALALSLKTANQEKKRNTDVRDSVYDSASINVEMQAKHNQDSEKKEQKKKKRPREIDQLVDTHWNESWLKDSQSPVDGRSDVISPSSREERALHYALARFAEMEYEKERVKSPTSECNQKLKVNVQPGKTRTKVKVRESGNEVVARKRTKKEADSEETATKKGSSTKITNSKKKEQELLRKARKHLSNKAQKNKENAVVIAGFSHQSNVRPSSKHLSAKTPTDKTPIAKTPTNKPSTSKTPTVKPSSSKTPTAPVQKKEYLLVPKYHGFKDFTPIVFDSRTRRHASSEDRDKIKKRDFPLMVVAKVGNETKKVIVQEGENKEEKLAEASNTVQKEFESLSKHKRYLNVNRNTGETVLHKAARLGYHDLAELQIQKGADVHAKDNAGWSALHEACAYGKAEVVKVLLKFGADPNCSSNSGVRPLHDAVERRDIRVLRLLLAYGADPSIRSYTGALPIDIAKTPQIRNFLNAHMEENTDVKQKRDLTKSEYGWQFQSSCDALDKHDCTGIFDDLPEDEQLLPFEFLMGNRPMPPSYYLPYTNEDDVVLGYKNYFIISDILQRLNISRNTLLKHHKFETRLLTYDKFVQYVRQNTLSHVPDVPSGSSKGEEIVELVFIGQYTFRKLMGLKVQKVT
ncbi:uncharacterized protein LOC130636714 [Hydractinia symbiolongicarpus]|uniref:uncharacterized protein LOC130636714 n=1 Tax=Hydractinia symbiolongicarpus TaxID=13093 RepID=UPI00254D15B0|nr:uncharacterized protein LOC130636714 [Hydractinia symbiolongicarpus]